MGTLYFVGAGLGDERDLSRRAVQTLGECDRLFAEEYTSLFVPGTLERLATELGRPIVRLSRAEVEGEARILAALRDGARVALVTAGDPFVATTHVALRSAVVRAGHSWQYLPAPSVLTAVASWLGLMHSRFGRPVSLPFVAPGFDPVSPWEQLAENRRRGLHTLVLLDLDPPTGRFRLGPDAVAELSRPRPGRPSVPTDALFAIVERVGRADASAAVGTADELATWSAGPPPHSVVVLAPTLHIEEREAIEAFRVRPGDHSAVRSPHSATPAE